MTNEKDKKMTNEKLQMRNERGREREEDEERDASLHPFTRK